jgi:membrane protein
MFNKLKYTQARIAYRQAFIAGAQMTVFRYADIVVKGFVDFFKDGGLMLAGSLSFFSMMAIVPFCLLLITIFGYFLNMHEDFFRFFVTKLVGFFPDVTQQITQELKRIIIYKGLGTFTFILYGLLSYQLFSSLEAAMNVIFKIKIKRTFIISLVLSLIIITLIIALILISFGVTSLIPMLKELKEIYPELRIGKITGFLIKFVVPFFLVLLTVTMLYILIPKKKINILHALSGALITSVFLEIANYIFTFYVGKVIKLGTIYGPLSAFIIFLLWLFYSWCIFLTGAEVVHNLEESKPKKRR